MAAEKWWQTAGRGKMGDSSRKMKIRPNSRLGRAGREKYKMKKDRKI